MIERPGDRIMIGQTLGRYRIVEKLGEGGMGVVYKARDIDLNRFVALKLLPPQRIADGERKRRFMQEARAASALNHPNIITIHDIAADNGVDFIVMEYVEGRTLAELVGKRLPLRDVLSYAAQIADGLARAHAEGIVHRDLKPSNIMITDGSMAKILDFGLAKLTEGVEADTQGQTVVAGDQPQTEEGVIVGTVAYMSPEQAEGKKVDARSDIFSFGSVLYEMLSGHRAFQAGSVASTLAAITTGEPRPVSEIAAALPHDVEQVVNRCLRKDPQRRFQSMAELKIVLEDLKEESDSGKLRAVNITPQAPRRSWWIAAAVSAAIVIAVAVVWMYAGKQTAAKPLDIDRLTFDSGVTFSPAISKDGTMVAYASDRESNAATGIWVQQLGSGKALRRTNGETADHQPDFSPDGSQIAFRAERDGGGIFVMDTLGGEPRKITDSGFFPRFSPDGTEIIYVDLPASRDASLRKMYLVSPKGGAPTAFQPEFSIEDATLGGAPLWSADGKYVLFGGRRRGDPATRDWWVAPRQGGAAIRTGAREALSSLWHAPFWLSPTAWDGRHVYYHDGTTVEGINLYRVVLDRGSWRIAGKPERLTSGPGMQVNPSISREGRLVYANMLVTMNLWSIAVDANSGKVSGQPQQITTGQMGKWAPAVSRDGSRLAYTAFGGLKSSGVETRVRDLATGVETAIPTHGTPARRGFVLLDTLPALNRDGSLIAYRDVTASGIATYVVRRGEATGRLICENCVLHAFSSDGNFAIVETRNQLVRQNLATGARTTLLDSIGHAFEEVALAPDDSTIAFAIGQPDGKMAIYVAPVGEGPLPRNEWTLIAEDNRYLASPAWSPDGRLLYYLSQGSGACAVWAQRVDASSRRPVGAPFQVYRHAGGSHQTMNVPKSNGAIRVAPDRLIFYLSDVSSNLYSMKLDPR